MADLYVGLISATREEWSGTQIVFGSCLVMADTDEGAIRLVKALSRQRFQKRDGFDTDDIRIGVSVVSKGNIADIYAGVVDNEYRRDQIFLLREVATD